MAEIIDLATRQRRHEPPCRHLHFRVDDTIVCMDCGATLDAVSCVRCLADLLAQQTAARTAAVRRARQLAGELRQARAALAPRQPDLVCHETGRAALAAAREILGDRSK